MERYIFLLSNGTSFVNFDAILRKLQLFSDGRLEGKNLCIVMGTDDTYKSNKHRIVATLVSTTCSQICIKRSRGIKRLLLLDNAISAIFQLYYGENKLIYNEMMTRFNSYEMFYDRTSKKVTF